MSNEELQIPEELLSDQTRAEMEAGRQALKKYQRRDEVMAAHRAAQQEATSPMSEADMAAASAQRLDRNAPPTPGVFPVAQGEAVYNPGKGKK